MSVKKQCYSCKHYSHGACLRCGSEMCGKEMKYWELSDYAKADVLHDAEQEHESDPVEVLLNRAKNKPEHDAVNHPNHYCKGGVECLDAIKAALGDKYEGFLAGNVLKYVYRYPDKNGVEDCKKARFYLDKLIEELSNEE